MDSTLSLRTIQIVPRRGLPVQARYQGLGGIHPVRDPSSTNSVRAWDVSTVHDFHGSADNPTLNGTLRHQDLDLALYQRARAKVDKYREGYAAQGLRHAFLPAIVSTSGRIHGELLRLLFNLADKKTSNSLAALGEAIDVESEVYCRRRSGNFWRMRAALGLACAQAATPVSYTHLTLPTKRIV